MPVIRHVTGADANQIAAIYDPLVEMTAISFEEDPPGPEEMQRRIEARSPHHPWLVIEEAGQILGYAYAAPYRERPAYRWSVETTVYLHPDHRGRGLGRALYTSLLEMTRHRGFAGAFAGITLPNPASEALHRQVGFRSIGVLPRAGFKLGEWHDVAIWHRPLATTTPPLEPTTGT
jgi:phosphinothricin acetyltransferase